MAVKFRARENEDSFSLQNRIITILYEKARPVGIDDLCSEVMRPMNEMIKSLLFSSEDLHLNLVLFESIVNSILSDLCLQGFVNSSGSSTGSRYTLTRKGKRYFEQKVKSDKRYVKYLMHRQMLK